MNKIFHVKDFGATGSGGDEREKIQACLNVAGAGATIQFERDAVYRIDPTGKPSGKGSEATFGGLRPLAGQTLLLNGAELKALDAKNGASCVVNVYKVYGVSVVGGAITGERSIHTGSTGEFGHCVSFRAADDFILRDCIIKDAWGDGVFVSTTQGGTRPTKRGLIYNCDFDLISRNAISVVSAHDITISNNKFRRIDRTAPRAAIDLEPDPPRYYPNKRIMVFGNRCIADDNGDSQCDFGIYIVAANENIQIFRNNFYGKYGSVGFGDNARDIEIKNNTLRAGSLGAGGNIWMVATSPSTIDGIEISNNIVRDGLSHAIYFGRPGYKGLSIKNNIISVTQEAARLAALTGGGTFQGNDVTFSGGSLRGQAYIGDFTNCKMGGNTFTNLTENKAQAYLPGATEQWPDNYVSFN